MNDYLFEYLEILKNEKRYSIKTIDSYKRDIEKFMEFMDKEGASCTYDIQKHCKECKKIVDDDVTKCRCGSTKFLRYNDIVDKTPFDKPIYIK